MNKELIYRKNIFFKFFHIYLPNNQKENYYKLKKGLFRTKLIKFDGNNNRLTMQGFSSFRNLNIDNKHESIPLYTFTGILSLQRFK